MEALKAQERTCEHAGSDEQVAKRIIFAMKRKQRQEELSSVPRSSSRARFPLIRMFLPDLNLAFADRLRCWLSEVGDLDPSATDTEVRMEQHYAMVYLYTHHAACTSLALLIAR